MRVGGEVFSAGAEFPTDFVTTRVNVKEALALATVLRSFCTKFPGRLRGGGQVIVDVDNQPVVKSFESGRSRDFTTHGLPTRATRHADKVRGLVTAAVDTTKQTPRRIGLCDPSSAELND